MHYTTPKLPPVSARLKFALCEELRKPHYAAFSEEIALLEAAKVFHQREAKEEILIFDRSNPSDQIFFILSTDVL